MSSISIFIRVVAGFRIWFALVLIFCSACMSAPPRSEHQPSSPPRATDENLPTLAPIAYTIQLGAFSTARRAADYAAHLRDTGLDAYYFIDRDGLFKVRFERFETKGAALQRAQALKASGLIDVYYIVEPRQHGPGSEDDKSFMGKNLVQTALRFMGTPYRWGGASVQQGFDCSGFAMTVYRLNGLELPRSTWDQYRSGNAVTRDALLGGDLVFFHTNGSRRVSHVGIYCGNNQFIHAPGEGKRIKKANLTNSYFKTRYLGARRYY